MHADVPLAQASRLVNHGPTVLVTTRHQGRCNVMAAAWLELRHIPEPHAEQAYDTVFGEVLSAQADSRVFANGRWHFADDNAALHTLHHLGGGAFAVPSRVVQARPHQS